MQQDSGETRVISIACRKQYQSASQLVKEKPMPKSEAITAVICIVISWVVPLSLSLS